MSIIKDSQGNELKFLDPIGGETLQDPRPITQNISALNGEIVMDCAGLASASIDIRGTFVGTFQIDASINGTDYVYQGLPMMNRTTELFQVAFTAAGAFLIDIPAGCRRIRVRCTAYTSGTAIIAMRGSTANNFYYVKPIPASQTITVTAAVGLAATLSLPAPGAGLFHYITRIIIQRFAAAAMTAAAAPVLVTTTNLPGSRVFSFPADAALQGTIYSETVEPSHPIKSSTANTATTIVCPATPNVIWRATADYYVNA